MNKDKNDTISDLQHTVSILKQQNFTLTERIKELEANNGKLNIILYHRENGLSHPDFKSEIKISKQAEQIEELEDYLIEFGKHKRGCLANITNGEHCTCGFEQALKGK